MALIYSSPNCKEQQAEALAGIKHQFYSLLLHINGHCPLKRADFSLLESFVGEKKDYFN